MQELIPIDLHTHSYYSDGVHSPEEVVKMAHQEKGQVLALTDHDTTEGLQRAQATAKALGIKLVSGLELSVLWQNKTVHILGLGLDYESTELQQGLQKQHDLRMVRAHQIAEKLAKLNIKDSLEGALSFCRYKTNLSRTHFARFLVQGGYCKSQGEAFSRYLGKGGLSYVQEEWLSLELGVKLIQNAKGLTSIAHLARYHLPPSEEEALVKDFSILGGHALEVISPSHNQLNRQRVSELANKYNLLCTSGNDFHDIKVNKIGKTVKLPKVCQPLWEVHTL